MNWPRIYVSFDVKGEREWSLLRVVALLAPFVATLRWRLDIELGQSPAAERILDAQRAGALIDGSELIAMLAEDPQAIEGALIGFSTNPDNPELVIKAVDGMHWDVYSDNERIIEEIERRVSAQRAIW